MSDPIEGTICLVQIKYADEINTAFVNCLGPDESGEFYLWIMTYEYPTLTENVVEWKPKYQASIRSVIHSEFQFQCDEVVDLDEWENMPLSDDLL